MNAADPIPPIDLAPLAGGGLPGAHEIAPALRTALEETGFLIITNHGVPQALIDAHRAARDGDLQVLGYYHSHPNGLAEPSATDRAIAAPDGSVWAIIAAERISFWRSGDAGFEALPYEVAPR